MSEIIPYLVGYGVPLAILIVGLFFMVIGIGFTTVYTRYFVLILLLIMLVIVQASNYGTEDGNTSAISIFWVKGTKSFFFSFYEMLLFFTWFFGVFIGKHWSKNPRQYSNPLSNWYVVFGIMFLGHVAVAMFNKPSIIVQFGESGVINVLKQGMFISLLFATVHTESDIKTLTKIILIGLAATEFWGLFRYVFLGGDPANVYANMEMLNVKITYFDINEHILACLMLGVCTWKLLAEKIGDWEKIAYSIMGTMALLMPLLSARRTAQFGLILAMLLLFLLLPKRRRFPILIVLLVALPIGLASVASRTKDPTKSIIEKVLIDVKTGDVATDPRKTRFYELETAWKTMKENPIFGVGPSGEFKVDSDVGLEYHGGHYGFVHSGFGHILLKTGFLGLFIFLGIYVTFVINILKGFRLVLSEHKALVVGSLCGSASLIPTFLSGTPIPEIRTMLVAGFLMAIPLICIAIAKRKIAASKDIEFNNLNKPSHSEITLSIGKLGNKH